MRFAVILLLTLLGGCAGLTPDQASNRTGRLSPDERAALYQKAREGAQQSHERYIATERPVLQRKFREEYPTMTDEDLEVLVNDALENGLRQEPRRRPDGPLRQPSLDCMSSAWRNSTLTNCY